MNHAAEIPPQPLYLAGVGQIVCLQCVSGDPKIRARLGALGFVQGAELCVLNIAFAGPLIVSLRDERLVLSREMAQHIWVR